MAEWKRAKTCAQGGRSGGEVPATSWIARVVGLCRASSYPRNLKKYPPSPRLRRTGPRALHSCRGGTIRRNPPKSDHRILKKVRAAPAIIKLSAMEQCRMGVAGMNSRGPSRTGRRPRSGAVSGCARSRNATKIDLLRPPVKYSIRLVADVAELADALDSKSGIRKGVWVRPPPSAPPFSLVHYARTFSSFSLVKDRRLFCDSLFQTFPLP